MPSKSGGEKQEKECGHANSNCPIKFSFGPKMESVELSNNALIDGSQCLVVLGMERLENEE